MNEERVVGGTSTSAKRQNKTNHSLVSPLHFFNSCLPAFGG